MSEKDKKVRELGTGEILSYALTNTGQTMIYGIITTYLLLFMTDYLFIEAAVAGLILSITRIFDAINDPIMGAILDKTHTRWGKCRPYMLFTPVPVALLTILLFAPIRLSAAGATIYASIIYLLFTLAYTANDIPYWSMSSVITTDPNKRVKVVTTTRIIGGLGSGLSVGVFWFVNKLFADSGQDKRMSFFCTTAIFCVFGTLLMLQGFFNTRERAVQTAQKEDKFFDNLKLVPKSRGLMINLLSGVLMSVMMVGTTALTTYFAKWNLKEIFPDMESNTIMSIFVPAMGILPGIAMFAGLFAAPKLIKKFEKKYLLLSGCALGIVANIIFYFVGYSNIFLFVIGRFVACLPLGVWSAVTTIMIGDSVDEIEFKTGRRVEGACFSLLTFISKFQNGANVAITGFFLSAAGYLGELDPDTQQQAPRALKMIFVLVTLLPALGYLLMGLPFLFYNFSKTRHEAILAELKRRKEEAIAGESPAMELDWYN
ncbi:MAG: MFS transporter [Christensenellales bacterium]|jgi:sugar (glycoside-pentoside-hexuronide) transporter